jgi:CSLREA domain-containing protein
MYMRRVIRLIVLFIVLIAVLTPSITQPQPAEAQGIVIRFALDADPVTLDPADPDYGNSSLLIANQIFEGLFRYASDGSIESAGATDYSISSNGLIYLINLRQTAIWTNGQPVVAQDYINGILRLGRSQRGYLLDPIAGFYEWREGTITEPDDVGIHALDDSTLEIVLHAPAAHFIHVLCNPWFNVPSRSLNPSSGMPLVYNGPYILEEWVSDDHVTLLKNDLYWDSANVQIEEIIFPIMPDADQQFTDYLNDQLDVSGYPSDQRDEILADSVLSAELRDVPRPGVFYIGLNTLRPPTDELSLRQALASSIDRQSIMADVYGIPGLPEAQGVIPPSMNGYQGTGVGYEFDITIPNPYLTTYMTENGILDESVIEVTLWSNSEAASIAGLVAQEWRDNLGITVTEFEWDWWEYLDELEACRSNFNPADPDCTFNAYRLGWIADYNDPWNILNDNFHPDSTSNYTHWDNGQYRTFLNEAVVETNEADRILKYQDAEDILVETDAAVIPIYFYNRTLLIKSHVAPEFPPHGWPPHIMKWSSNLPWATNVISYRLHNPVTLDGEITSPEEWADTVAFDISLDKAWGWPDKQTEPSDKTVTARFKNDGEWIYILYQLPWLASDTDPDDGASIALFCFGGCGSWDVNDTSVVGFDDATGDAYGWTGSQWTSDIDSGGANDVEGAASHDGTSYWYEFRKRLDSGDGYDWILDPPQLVGHPNAPQVSPHLLVGMWDNSEIAIYEGYISMQLSDAAIFVNSTDDPGDGVCDAAECTLREAINLANVGAGLETISFNIPGAGPHVISPISPLPTITDPVIIDGYSQPGSSPNTNPPELGSNAVIMVELDGSQAGSVLAGLNITAGDSTVKGLAINRFNGNGIALMNNGNNTVTGNFIGTDVMGVFPQGNSYHGIRIEASTGNVVGGITSAAWNLISSNGFSGVSIGDTSQANTVQGNLISGNLENGISIEGAPSSINTITKNAITENTAKGIELLAGANGGLEPPSIDDMLGDQITGHASPHSTIEIFTDVNGEGAIFLDSVLADLDGDFTYAGPFEGPNLTATATDGGGNTSEFSQPIFWAPDTCEFNESFEEACNVAGELGFPLSSSGSFTSYISRPDDVDWFYFDIGESATPGDQITISLSGLDETALPANYDLVVLAELTVDPATNATPLQGVPLQGVPLQGVPLQGVPLQGVPLQGVPLQGVPLQGVTVQEIPLQGVPLQGVPLQGVPLQGVPLQGVPLQGVPLQGVPLQGVGFHQGKSPEVVSTLYRGGMTGKFYILVWSSTGEFGITPEASQYEVKVVTHPVVVDACVTGIDQGLLGDPLEGPLTKSEEPHTLILVHRPRLVALYGLEETNDLVGTLEDELLDHSLVEGVIVDLGDPSFYVGDDAAQTLEDAYAEWDQYGCQAETANLVTLEIKKTILQILGQHESIENIVIVGADKIIPHRRVPDGVVRTEESATVPNEYDYQFQSVEDGYEMGNIAVRKNPLHATLRLQYYLSDDFYADLAPILLQQGHELSVPDLPIGRLVETPGDMTTYINTFIAQDGLMGDEGVSISSISTGYEFLDDQAAAISEVFDLKEFTPNPALISDSWNSGTFEDVYGLTQSDVRDIASLNAHFDHWRMATADGSIITSTDLGPMASESQARLIFSVGCHAGFNFPDEDALSFDEPGQLDHAQALLANGATLIGNWGFGYGDDAALAYSEELMLNFARYLGDGTLGQALTQAKREYILNQAVLDPVHEKVLMEAIYYGLPMWQLSAEIVEIDDGFIADSTPDPQYNSDVRYELVVDTEYMQVFDIEDRGSYYTLSGQTQAALFRPIQPKGSIDISGIPGQVAHGVLFTDGAYNDILDFDPILTMPVWTQSVPELHFIFEGWDPARFWSLAQLERADGSFDEKLVIVPGQFNVDEDETILTDETVGTERIYESLSFEIFYGSSTSEFQPPAIGLVQASLGDNQSVLFKVAVEDPPDLQGQSSGIVHVIVTYTQELGGSTWQSEDLALNLSSGKWEGTIDINQPIDFFIQAVDGAGNTGMFAGNGYFTPTAVAAQGPSEMSAGEVVDFSTTFDPEFEDPEVLWDFGDGSVAEGSDTVSHAFSQPGEYEVVVRVVDSEGNIGEATVTVQVEPAFTTLTGLVDGLASLPVSALRAGNEDYRETLLEKVLETSSKISRGEIKGAIQKLKKDIRAKMDGCSSKADKNDWVVDCTWQYDLRALIDDLIGSLEEILASG